MQKGKSLKAKTLMALASIIGILLLLIIGHLLFPQSALIVLDTILASLPPKAEFKKTCQELNGKRYSWNEIKKLKGYCVELTNDEIRMPLCAENTIRPYNQTNDIYSTQDVEGTWICSIKKDNDVIKTRLDYIHL